jgi:hypothetical protein
VRALDLLHASKTAGRRPARDPVVIRFVCGSDRPPGTIC